MECAIEHFARTEISHFVVRLLQRFDKLESTEDPPLPIAFKFNLSIRSGYGVQVRLHESSLAS